MEEKAPNYIDNAIHWIVTNAFKWRYLILLICIGVTVLCLVKLKEDKATLLQILEATAYSGAIISMLYVVITFEFKQNADIKKAREKKILFTYKKCSIYSLPEFSKNRHEMQTFFGSQEKSMNNGQIADVYENYNLPENLPAKLATQDILNYLEEMSSGVLRGILDEDLTKELFGTLVEIYYNKLNSFIIYHRKEKKSSAIWIQFTNLAEKWKK